MSKKFENIASPTMTMAHPPPSSHGDDDSRASALMRIDTCQWSILHRFFTSEPSGHFITFWRAYFSPYFIAVILFFLIPLFIASHTLPTLYVAPTEDTLTYLRDLNLHFMCLVSIPLLLTILLNERSLIPVSLAKIARAGVLRINIEKIGEFCVAWTRRYRWVNFYSQFIGIAAGAMVSWGNYHTVLHDQLHSWQIHNGQVTIPGWMFYCWQIPAFCFIAALILIRGVATVFFLYAVVKVSKIKITPYHPDNACGLSPIGRLGLRNQYSLAAVGINLFFVYYCFRILNPGTLTQNVKVLLTVAVALYLLSGPVIFFAPLLPFRRSMKKKKMECQHAVDSRLSEEFLMTLGEVPASGVTKEREESINRLLNYRNLVLHIPVWPYDILTLRRFLRAYVTPILFTIATKIFELVVSGKIFEFLDLFRKTTKH